MEYEIFKSFIAHSDAQAAGPMAAYMKNHFPFLGLRTPLRRALARDFIKSLGKMEGVNWGFVHACFDKPEREYQYLALDYLNAIKKRIPRPDMANIEALIQTKSWWDSVDSLDQVVGCMIQTDPELKDTHVRVWMMAENIWLKRVAIDCQLTLKEKTDTVLLADAILANLGSKEFFVNKAIGWALRDYSKTNRSWVSSFIAQHKNQMAGLSVREGSKYL